MMHQNIEPYKEQSKSCMCITNNSIILTKQIGLNFNSEKVANFILAIYLKIVCIICFDLWEINEISKIIILETC